MAEYGLGESDEHHDGRGKRAADKAAQHRSWVNNLTEKSKLLDVLQRENGALGRIRTPDPLIRSQVLYPTELPALG